MNSPPVLPSVQSDEFLPPISRWLTLSGLFLVTTVTALVTLSAIVKYNDSIKAPAFVRLVKQPKTTSKLLIKAYVAVQDINAIKPKQSVQLRLSACPYPEYGLLEGTVTAISADVVKSEVPSYEVTIQPKALALIARDRCSLKAGMEGRADFPTRQQTVLQFLMSKARLSF